MEGRISGKLWWYKKNIYRKGKKAENAPSCMEIWELRIPNPGKSVGQHHSEWQWIELVYRDVLSVFCIWKVFFICLWVKWEICSIIRSIFFDFLKISLFEGKNCPRLNINGIVDALEELDGVEVNTIFWEGPVGVGGGADLSPEHGGRVLGDVKSFCSVWT